MPKYDDFALDVQKFEVVQITSKHESCDSGCPHTFCDCPIVDD